LAQIILGGRGFKFVQRKGIALLQGEIIAKEKNTENFKKSSSLEPAGQIQSNLVQIILGEREIKFVQIKGQVLFKGEIITKMSKWGGVI
jgi:hypothetical protein